MSQLLGLHAPSARGLGSIPGQGTSSHMPHLRVRITATKDSPCHHEDRRSCVPQLRASAAKLKKNFFLKAKCRTIQRSGVGGGFRMGDTRVSVVD